MSKIHMHDHDHDHGPGHHHHHDHDHHHGPGLGHNRAGAPPLHLHSHMEPEDEAEELAILSTQFIEGFREATDKAAYLRLAGVPLELADPDGGPSLKLVDIALKTAWQVGTASPSFGSKELSYLPFPGAMIQERANFDFVYVSLEKRLERDLRDFLRERMGRG